MKFKLITSKYLYSKKQVEKLGKLGFNFRESKFNPEVFEVIDKNLPNAEINTLEELMNLIKSYGRIVISDKEIVINDGDTEVSHV